MDLFLGIFEPPVDGVYIITAYAVTWGYDDGPMYIKNNGDVLCQAHVYPSEGIAFSCSAIVQLVIGDSVRVTGDNANPGAIQAIWSGFVGHIINDNLTV